MEGPPEKIPAKKALILIVTSLCVTTALFFLVFVYFRCIRSSKAQDPKYYIQVIAQKCRSPEPLQTLHLLELLNLSTDKPVSIYGITSRMLEKRLYACPVIKEASVSFLEPGVVVVDYKAREPIALLGDYVNIALDGERRAFPLEPYLSAKKLPEILLGSSILEAHPSQWLKPLEGPSIETAFCILAHFQEQYSRRGVLLRRLDMQKAFSSSSDREIVLEIEADRSYLIRLHSTSWKEGLERFFILYPLYIENALVKHALLSKETTASKEKNVIQSVIVDLRLPQLAFVK